MKTFWLPVAIMAACCASSTVAWAEDDDKRLAKGIQDNSFLIEEAYNQEPGVVQHIATLQRQGRDFNFNFTQEWPIGSQAHQFSYSIPYSWLRLEDRRTQGFGDVQLNYRYQAWTETDFLPAFAPRLSLIFPTGNPRKELGDGSLGYEVNLPFSKIIADRVTVHFNAGMSTLFDVHGQQPTNLRVGGSVIYAVTRDWNFLVEVLGEREESVNAMREIERENSLTVNPGVRFAVNFKDESQLVMGASSPIRFTKDDTDVGFFLYLSYEHKYQK